jgi:hypothetical protein
MDVGGGKVPIVARADVITAGLVTVGWATPVTVAAASEEEVATGEVV